MWAIVTATVSVALGIAWGKKHNKTPYEDMVTGVRLFASKFKKDKQKEQNNEKCENK